MPNTILEMSANITDADIALRLFEKVTGHIGVVSILPGSGSDRKYARIMSQNGETMIATIGEDKIENLCFYNLAMVFSRAGCSVPSVYIIDDGGAVYLQEDLGTVQLLDLLKTDRRLQLSEKALEALVEIQTVDESLWSRLVMCPPFSKRQIMWDLNYFKYEFLKPSGITFNEDLLEDDFEKMADNLSTTDERLLGFMYRDFQSRNVMIKNDTPYLIDFQGGRKGPLIYDAVSYLWQSKAAFTDEERRMLLFKYAEALSSRRRVTVEEILSEVDKYALFRTLQVLGAYGFRGLVEKKSHFIESIPGALRNLKELIERGVLGRYPELERVAKACCKSRYAVNPASDSLTLKVFSFSYKRGYPEDLTGNGGGFMFDCRGMHNPGRYDCYKQLTGLDESVSVFLEEKGEVGPFVMAAVEIVSPTITRYMQRGFSSLQVGFGCTGGQHRSVYCARHFADAIRYRFPELKIELCHRELGKIETI